ncbi:hypothetical protein B0H17DRAFT_1141013 [Mycena rosella]|uniref:Uncharacterized protein n=1 Tax=Mycena rosella TaxID=1033263 RepID=A0AAD7D1Z6_MYCRO|nr:hypothetical protein B0H17DRAFT_1141013 [Mycena rosella]
MYFLGPQIFSEFMDLSCEKYEPSDDGFRSGIGFGGRFGVWEKHIKTFLFFSFVRCKAQIRPRFHPAISIACTHIPEFYRRARVRNAVRINDNSTSGPAASRANLTSMRKAAPARLHSESETRCLPRARDLAHRTALLSRDVALSRAPICPRRSSARSPHPAHMHSSASLVRVGNLLLACRDRPAGLLVHPRPPSIRSVLTEGLATRDAAALPPGFWCDAIRSPPYLVLAGALKYRTQSDAFLATPAPSRTRHPPHSVSLMRTARAFRSQRAIQLRERVLKAHLRLDDASSSNVARPKRAGKGREPDAQGNPSTALLLEMRDSE